MTKTNTNTKMTKELTDIKEGKFYVEYVGNLYEYIGEDDSGKLLLSDVNDGYAVSLPADDVLLGRNNITIHRRKEI